MEQRSELKSARLLEIYTRLEQGRTLKKADLAQEFHVTQRSIQRDVEDLRCFLAERHLEREVIYDGKQRGYRMVSGNLRGLTNSEILAVCKILLESRSLPAKDMGGILDKLIDCAVPQESQKAVRELVANEKLHYIPPHHGQSVLGDLWELGQAIRNQQVVEIGYERMKEPKLVQRRVQPVGIMFSEYYFYLTAFLEDKTDFDNPDDLFPTIYRIDRIRAFRATGEHFTPAYAKRFQEGEFRRRVQFMYGGKLQKIRFKYTGPSIEAVLDRLPTAEILSQDDSGWTISAEVFGKGIEMWMRSQGDYIQEIHEKERNQHGKPSAN